MHIGGHGFMWTVIHPETSSSSTDLPTTDFRELKETMMGMQKTRETLSQQNRPRFGGNNSPTRNFIRPGVTVYLDPLGSLTPRGSRYPGVSWPPPWVSWPPGGKISLIWYLACRYPNRGILTPSRKFKVLNQSEKHFQYYVRWGWRYRGLGILTPT